jgi:hypothetical protein
MPTLELSLNISYVSEEEAERIVDEIGNAVAGVVGRVPNTSHMVVPDYDGPGRSEEEAAKAAAEGRR